MHGLANRIRGLAEIEIEDPIYVGNHGAVPPAKQTLFETALFAQIGLVTVRKPKTGWYASLRHVGSW
jgi:hypothetical protein